MMQLEDQILRSHAERSKKQMAEHRASLQRPVLEAGTAPVTVLLWRKPGYSDYAITAILRGGDLFITGDLGSAVYRWFTPMTFYSIANMGFEYFLSKYETVEGSGASAASQWNPELCQNQLFSFIESRAVENFALREPEDTFNKWIALTDQEKHSWLADEADEHHLDGWDKPFEIREDFIYWANDHHEYFGESEMYVDWGMIPIERTVAHWMAIKMAVEQLKEEHQRTHA